MAFRGNQNRNRNFGGGNQYNGPMGTNRMGGMNMSPWESQNPGGGQFGNNMRQGGGGQMNAQAINLANNLLNNLFRNQNPPSLLDLPRGGMGNRNQRGGQMVNRGGGAGNRLNNRRGQGGFQNRGVTSGPKPPQKQGAGGIRKQNAFDRAKKLLAKNANTNKKKEITPGEKKIESTATSPKESPYASVPNDMFYCHLCKKHMWDANSFENHIKGRTHLMMREGIEESYRLKANMIRQEAKIAEQLKSIEFDRLKRMGKSKQRQLDYCTMCDLNFHGHISTHRKSEGHLQLKKFLHPKCVECNKEFATRIDYDTHLLSADHLKKAAENNTKVGERKRQTLPISTAEEETRDLRPPQKRKKKPIKKEGEEATATEVKKEIEEGAEGEEPEGEEPKEGEEPADETKEGEDLNESQEEEEVALPVDPEDCILDFLEGDEIPSEVDTRLPKYNWQRPVGPGLISKLECFECAVCSKFFDTEATAEIHSRTATHHRNFLKFINEKSSDTKIAQKRAAAAIEENERKKRKIEETEAPAAEGSAEETAEGGEGELYDPSEATGDDEDFEMTEQPEGEEEGGDEEVAGDENGDEMEAQEEEDEAEPEPEPEPEPTPVPTPAPVAQPAATPAKPEPAAKTPAKAAGAAAAAATPVAAAAGAAATPATAAAATPTEATPLKKPRTAATAAATAAAAGAGAGPGTGPKSTPQRQRARGRYNRY
ncbi:zinc finger protein on ecdysone puffs isoform X1 [Drosophila grimshawi]|uniref:zinc finger protein on ecdysone puffs isoform X1 n=1 Tax=Drosophila grimshawi TaxID=7222 RepID=UPI000C86FF9B|nr:zinc finger protein on ecdysone puffs isoform X1 [Drosophila grimshawi]XP_032598850.1 zinc finger protein on ecdysone puffs isoform X1 [Drosophila grimshawi]